MLKIIYNKHKSGKIWWNELRFQCIFYEVIKKTSEETFFLRGNSPSSALMQKKKKSNSSQSQLGLSHNILSQIQICSRTPSSSGVIKYGVLLWPGRDQDPEVAFRPRRFPSQLPHEKHEVSAQGALVLGHCRAASGSAFWVIAHTFIPQVKTQTITLSQTSGCFTSSQYHFTDTTNQATPPSFPNIL